MTVKRRMSAMSAIQTSTTSTVVTAAYATTLVPSSRGCAADVWKDPLLSAMAVTSTKNAPLSKCITRPNTLKGITKSFALSPGLGYPSPRKSSQNSMPLSLLLSRRVSLLITSVPTTETRSWSARGQSIASLTPEPSQLRTSIFHARSDSSPGKRSAYSRSTRNAASIALLRISTLSSMSIQIYLSLR